MKSEIKPLIKSGRHAAALDLLLKVGPSDDPELVEYAADQFASLPPEVIRERVSSSKRLAILGGSTTSFLVPYLRLFACRRGVRLEVYESDFGLFEQEILADSAQLRAFMPDMIHLHVTSRNLPFPPYATDPARQVEEQVKRFAALYRLVGERYGCALITNNFETAVERPYGALDTAAGSRNSMIRALNAALAEALPAQVYINDIEQLSASCGKELWFDLRLWCETKTTPSLRCHPLYADRLAAMVAALSGKSRKCLVLDLDNTLWGGVIGDDGLSGIRLGAGHASGESFSEFQAYVKALKQRGVLLAVASKNERDTALAPFREHRDMVLREDDISAFVANWEPKDGSLRQIARQLNIGLDAMVFFDDNPAERQLVASRLPEVLVIEVPKDPADYVRALDGANPFDTIALTQEDQIRAEFFQQNEAREQLAANVGSYEEFLASLAMRAEVEPVSAANLERVAQLINKTNQFNLTTLRLTEAQVAKLIDDPESYTSTTRIADKFGSYGLISVVIGRIDSGALTIINWLMSCRVLKRDVEVLEMERLLAFCRDRGVNRIIGHYVPSERNELVREHYAQLGFVSAGEESGRTTWEFAVTGQPLQRRHFISN